MTRARRQHLEWVREHEPVALFPVDGSGPTLQQARRLETCGDIEPAGAEPRHGLGLMRYRLSEQGRQKLREADTDIGRDAVEHLRAAYPAALAAVAGTAAVSLRNFINNRDAELLKKQGKRPSMMRTVRHVLAIAVTFSFPAPALSDMPVCTGPDRAARKLTCVYDGDTGWEHGRKWRLLDIDAPELGVRDAGCRTETLIGTRSRDRLRALMTSGYRIIDSGKRDRSKRLLVRVQLADGRDAGAILIREGLAQPWPNKGNRWCGW